MVDFTIAVSGFFWWILSVWNKERGTSSVESPEEILSLFRILSKVSTIVFGNSEKIDGVSLTSALECKNANTAKRAREEIKRSRNVFLLSGRARIVGAAFCFLSENRRWYSAVDNDEEPGRNFRARLQFDTTLTSTVDRLVWSSVHQRLTNSRLTLSGGEEERRKGGRGETAKKGKGESQMEREESESESKTDNMYARYSLAETCSLRTFLLSDDHFYLPKCNPNRLANPSQGISPVYKKD